VREWRLMDPGEQLPRGVPSFAGASLGFAGAPLDFRDEGGKLMDQRVSFKGLARLSLSAGYVAAGGLDAWADALDEENRR
jgi:hypothetical protein